MYTIYNEYILQHGGGGVPLRLLYVQARLRNSPREAFQMLLLNTQQPRLPQIYDVNPIVIFLHKICFAVTADAGQVGSS